MAKLKGVVLKTVIGSLMSGTNHFPEYKKMIDEMKDNEWYSWDLYTQMLQDISKKLGPIVVSDVGMNVIISSRNNFVKEQGFDTLEKLLKDYPEMFNKTIVGLPPYEQIKLIQFEPGHVIMYYTTRQPKAFIEGTIRGFFKIYNQDMKALKIKKKDHDYYELEVLW